MTAELATVMHCSTAGLVARVLDVFAPEATSVLDTTYGSGCFWGAAKPAGLIAGDLDAARARDVACDYTALPFRDGAVDVVCFDPPHLCDMGERAIMRDRYSGFANGAALEASLRHGLRECHRVARRLVIAKLANYVHGGKPYRLTWWAEDEIGPAYEIVLERKSATGRDPKWKRQRTPRCRDSRFLIWEVA